MDDDEIRDATNELLAAVARQTDKANAFSDWAVDHQLVPLDLLAIIQTIYVYLRTSFPESVTVTFMAYVTTWTEHLLQNHPETFGYPDLGLQGSPTVGDDDEIGSGQQMLMELGNLMKAVGGDDEYSA